MEKGLDPDNESNLGTGRKMKPDRPTSGGKRLPKPKNGKIRNAGEEARKRKLAFTELLEDM
jgi:hypothetical protein